MKPVSVLLFLTILLGLISCQEKPVDDIVPEILLSVTQFQQYTLDELNLVRTNPAEYAQTRLKSESENGSDNGSYHALVNSTPIGPISFCNSLNLSASKYALLLSEKSLMGHDEDGTPLKRAMMVGFVGTTVGENIAASTGDGFNPLLDPKCAAVSFVKIMIIDTGVSDLGHRLTILNPKFKSVGIGFNRNPASTYVNYMVQDFGNQ